MAIRFYELILWVFKIYLRSSSVWAYIFPVQGSVEDELAGLDAVVVFIVRHIFAAACNVYTFTRIS